MRSHSAWLLLLGPVMTLTQAQTGRSQAVPVQAPLQQTVPVMPAPLSGDQIERLIAPFAGAPQDVLGIVLDACRYPAALLEATAWAHQPEATRGQGQEAWPPTVRTLAENAPRTLEYLTQDIATTAALGSAYQHQPNDVWLAYGRVTARQADALAPQATASSSAPVQAVYSAAAPVGATKVPAAQPVAGAGSTTGQAVSQPQPPPPVAADSSASNAPPPAAPANSGISPGGAALVGGVIGLGAGLLIGELANNNNDNWRTPYGRPYPVPVPYAPHPARYGGAGPYAGTGQRYDATRALQEDRQAAGREMQQDRQSSVAARQGSSQAATADRQGTRQQSTSGRQQARRDDVAGTTAQRPQAPQRPAGGPERRAEATVGQARQQAATQRPSARPVAARSTPEWGPARGMAGGVDTARARPPSAGAVGRTGGGGTRAPAGGGQRGGRG